MLSKLDELVEDPDEGMDGVDGVAEGSSTAAGGDDEEEVEELGEEDMRALAQELYDELRGADALVSVAKFKNW